MDKNLESLNELTTFADMCKKNARFYGFDAQSLQCIEEMSELTKALIKYRRASGKGQPVIGKTENEILKNIIEELADVKIMIYQLTYLLDVGDDVMNMMLMKIDRQEKIRNGDKT